MLSWAGSGMVPGHSLGQGTGVQRYGASEFQMSLSLAAGEEEYQVVVVRGGRFTQSVW